MQRCSYLWHDVKNRITQAVQLIHASYNDPNSHHYNSILRLCLWLPEGLSEMINEGVNTLNERAGPNDLKSLESLKL